MPHGEGFEQQALAQAVVLPACLSVHVLVPQLTLLCSHTLAGTPPGGFFLTEQPASAQG